MKAKLFKIEDTAKNIKTFWFKPKTSFRYNAGQFVELELDHDNPDDRGLKRWFTLSSSPTESEISITTKFSQDHSSSFKIALQNLQLGSEITISEPMGDFILPKNESFPLIFVAGGIGITPYRSILKSLIDTNKVRNINLLYSVHKIEEVAFAEILKSSTINLDYFYDSQKSSRSGPNIKELKLSINLLYLTNPESLIYISGPENFVEQLEIYLLTSGVDASALVLDFFPNYNLI